MNIETSYRENYHHTVLTCDQIQNEKTLIAAGLDATDDPFPPEDEQGRILVSLADRYVAVTAKAPSLLFALDALEAKNGVFPSHVFQIIGGETRLYPVIHDTLVRSFFMDQFGLFASSLTIETGSNELVLPPISREQYRLFWQIEDEILCGDIHSFFRDVWDFNLGLVSVEAKASIVSNAL